MRVKGVRGEMYAAAMKTVVKTVVIYIFSSSDSRFISNEDINMCKKDFKKRVTEVGKNKLVERENEADRERERATDR